MISRIKYFLVLSTALLVSSCAVDDDSSEESQIELPEIVGVWEWVGTIKESDNTSDNPESSGTTRDIVITEDSFTFFVDDEVLAERAYDYSLQVSVLTGIEEFIVTFEDNGFRDIIRREDDFINFVDDCEECYISIYRLKD